MSTLARFSGRISGPKRFGPSGDDLIDPDTMLGLEIEVENCDSIDKMAYDYFNVVSDASLRPREYGREFVFNILESTSGYRTPLRGKEMEVAIQEYCKMMEKNSHTFSSRTGLHVHLNVLDFQEKELINLVYLYLIFEHVLYTYCGKDRIENTYSKPFSELDSVNLFKGSPKFSTKFFQEFTKRSALNLRTIYEKGTVEFRMHPATDKYEDIIDWINIILCLKREAIKGPDFQGLSERVSYDKSDILLESIFGQKIGNKLSTEYSKRDLYRGIRNYQQLVANLSGNLEILRKIHKGDK